MQPHDDEFERLNVDVHRMLSALPRERHPGVELEESVVQRLKSRRLLVVAERRARMPRQRRQVALTWPTAAAAAALLFVSGVLVGSSGGRVNPATNSQPSAVTAATADVPAQAAGDLLLASDSRASVTRAIKF